ncbi:hypothetical protein [Raineya sp.]
MKIKKSDWIIGSVLVVFLASLPFWLPKNEPSQKKRKLDWTPTFKKIENKPYASKAFYLLLEDLFPKKKIKLRLDVFPNDSLFLYKSKEVASKYNLFYAHLKADADQEFANALNSFVYYGGEAFMAAEYFSYLLENEFGKALITRGYTTSNALEIRFLHPKLAGKTYLFPNLTHYSAFQVYGIKNFTPNDTKQAQIDDDENGLASENNLSSEHASENNLSDEPQAEILAVDQYENPVFIKIKKGSGTLYACSLPLIFTNYGILDDNQRDFIARVISHLPVRDVLWEDEIKWRYQYTKREDETPEGIKELAFLRKNPPLWWAFWLTLAGIALFILFKAKREQRIIPILEKNTNTSLEFAQTIGRLYFNYQDHRNLAEKKILYFLEFLRSNYFINISENPDEATIHKIASKLAVSEEKVKETFTIIQEIKAKPAISEDDLHKLTKYINQIKKATMLA